jgi:hypothetical protein
VASPLFGYIEQVSTPSASIWSSKVSSRRPSSQSPARHADLALAHSPASNGPPKPVGRSVGRRGRRGVPANRDGDRPRPPTRTRTSRELSTVDRVDDSPRRPASAARVGRRGRRQPTFAVPRWVRRWSVSNHEIPAAAPRRADAVAGNQPAVQRRRAYSEISPKSSATHASSPMISASWPGGTAMTSPGPNSWVVPSSMTTRIRPDRT